MMTKLRKHVELGVAMELKEANKNNPPVFNSLHEGYGVIKEEMDEAWDAAIDADLSYDKLMDDIRADDKIRLGVSLESLEAQAVNTACEYIQVAAMARKMRGGLN